MSYPGNYVDKRKRSPNRVNHKLILCLVAIMAIGAFFLKSYQWRLDPSEVVVEWHEAMHDGDIETAERYTSETAASHIENEFGSMTEYSMVYYTRQSRGNAHLIDHYINGDVATVVSISCYDDGTQREWEDTLFLEEGVWKVAPQYVTVRPAPSYECS